MFYERSTLLHNSAAEYKPASDDREQFGAVQRFLVFLLCVVIFSGSALAVAAPFAALHIR